MAYAAEVKTGLLGVDAGLVRERGTVDAEVAVQMAQRARLTCGATHGVATTGEAGPEANEDKPVGTVHVAVAGPGGVVEQQLALSGDRAEIRSATVRAALSLLVARLGEESADPGR